MKRREFIGAGLVLGASVPLRGWSDVIGNAGDIAAKSLDGADAKVEQMRGIWRELEPMTQGFYTNYDSKGTADARYRDADFTRIGLVGHSLGGYTVLGLAGAWPSWTLEDVRAVVAMSPYVRPYSHVNGVARLKAPVLYQGGTRDVFTPFLQGAYDGSPSPKGYVEFASTSHFTWTDGGPGSDATREAMAAWAIAFLDRHVKGRADAPFPDARSPLLVKALRAPAD